MIRIGPLEIDRKNFTVRRGNTVLVFAPNGGRPPKRPRRRVFVDGEYVEIPKLSCWVRTGAESLVSFRLLCHLLLAGPRTCEELFELIYADCESGGPLAGSHVIHIFMHRLKSACRELSLELQKSRRAGRHAYAIVPREIDAVPDARRLRLSRYGIVVEMTA